jgi:(p)ppGpp synthase/HD superfamily hydrolase
MDIYIPVAERLGIYKMKTPLEDLCFRILNINEYSLIEEQV